MFWFFFGFLLYFLVTLAERALVGVSPHELDQLGQDNSAAAQRAYRLGQEGVRPALAALLLARLFLAVLLIVSSVAGLMSSVLVRTALHDAAQWSGWSGKVIWGLAGILWAALFGLLFWGIQKIDIQKNSSTRATFLLLRLGYFIQFWKTLFRPFLLQENRTKTGENNPVQELSNPAITSEKREMELLKSIVKFSDVTVKQVMQPRSKVVGVDFKMSFHDLLAVVRESEFSRLPVYDDDLDYITGMLYVKDLLLHLNAPADFEWQPLIRTNVMLVPESKRCSELLEEFKQQKIHMAIVVDEYGGSAGIVTMEDILEEVTGDIRDEFDEESEIRYRKLDEHNYLFEGQTLLNDVCRITGLDAAVFDPVKGNADTLAGLALEIRGDIPKVGVEIAWNGFLFTITAADDRRISQMKLTLPKA
ncbi:MAG: CBS domain-containing protein [Saprospiraceae bacterium]|nr:CBS domain-containing protein [Saprospiraceae bacterium]